MRSSIYLAAWTAFCFCIGAGQAAFLPHPSCNVTVYPVSQSVGSAHMVCLSDELHIPGNFNVDPLYNGQLDVLTLGQFHNNTCTASRNVIADNVQPIRAGVGLTFVIFCGFQSGGTWDRFHTLLSNSKGSLGTLILDHCAIKELPATFLRGYHSLYIIEIRHCELEAIDLNAFSTGTTASISPGMRIRLTGNKLESFDWAVFQPVADVLTEIDLSAQMPPLRRTTNTKNTLVKNLWFLNVANNQLSFPLQTIQLQLDGINSINPNEFEAWLEWDLSNNSFCPNDPSRTCACCEARDFVASAHAVNRTKQFRRFFTKLRFTCGDTSDTTDSTWNVIHVRALQDPDDIETLDVNLPSLQQYDCCISGTCRTPPPKPATTSGTVSTTVELATSTTSAMQQRTTAGIPQQHTTAGIPQQHTTAGIPQQNTTQQNATGALNSADIPSNRTPWIAFLFCTLMILSNVLESRP